MISRRSSLAGDSGGPASRRASLAGDTGGPSPSRAASGPGTLTRKSSFSSSMRNPVQKTTPFKLNIQGMRDGTASKGRRSSVRDIGTGDPSAFKDASSRIKRLRRWERQGTGKPAGLSMFEELKLRVSELKETVFGKGDGKQPGWVQKYVLSPLQSSVLVSLTHARMHLVHYTRQRDLHS
jgi:hypothetical protein